MSVFDAAERFASMDRSQIMLDTKRCLHTQDQSSGCAACFDLCPANAITQGKPPALNVEACQSCLACIPACPVGAYHADDAVSSLLSCISRIESGIVELICSKHPHPEIGTTGGLGVRVQGCLAGLGAGAYLLLTSLGLEKFVVRTDACEECAWVGLQKQVENQVSEARLFMAAWGKSDQLLCVSKNEGFVERPLWDSKNPPLSRRDLFRVWAQQGKISMARALENGQNTSNNHNPGRDRLRLLTAVKHLPAPESGTKLSLGSLNFALITISEVCNACGVCGRACPTNALHFEKNESEASYALKFLARNCVGCDICVHVCAPSAMTLNHTPHYSQIFDEEMLIIQEGKLTKCQGCGALIAGCENKRFCSLCEYRREHPFGSMLPPGAQLGRNAKKKALS